MELVGPCCQCGTPVYCKDGFLDGVSENGRLYCHTCYAAQASTPEADGEHDSQCK